MLPTCHKYSQIKSMSRGPRRWIIKKKSLTESISCQGLPKNGGDLLSQLVGQYHRRG